MRNLVIIDGSNFYHKAKALAQNIHFSTFNYRKLFEDIIGSTEIAIERRTIRKSSEFQNGTYFC